jgi:DNA repair protein RecO (recombination protein O)
VLAELGQPLDLQHCVDGNVIEATAYYRWLPEQGMIRSGQGFRGADLLAIGAGDWQPDSLRAAKQLCRQLLQPLLGQAPLLSRQLFQGYLA